MQENNQLVHTGRFALTQAGLWPWRTDEVLVSRLTQTHRGLITCKPVTSD